MKNRYLSGARKSIDDDSFKNIKQDLIIKLRYPNAQIKEIYDLDDFPIYKSINDTSSNTSYSLNSGQSNLSSTFNASSSASSLVSNSNSVNNYNRTNSSPRSSISKSERSENVSLPFDTEEPFTFQDFVSSILNSDNKEYHVLIIQDIARLLELKYRDFIKSSTNFNSSTKSAGVEPKKSIYLDPESDLFTKIAQDIFKLAIEEPNGILGARIRFRLMFLNGKLFDISECFPYDQSTMATSEIIVTIKEDKSYGLKKFLQSSKMFSNFKKYFMLNIDSKCFEIVKNRLY